MEIDIVTEQETKDLTIFRGKRFEVKFTDESLDTLKEKLEKLRDSNKDWQTHLLETVINKMKYIKIEKGTTLLKEDLNYSETADSIANTILEHLSFDKKKKVIDEKSIDEKLGFEKDSEKKAMKITA